MNILFIINSLRNKSGTERVAIELANALIEKNDNFSISIINRNTSYDESAYPVNPKIRIIPIGGNLFSFTSQIQTHVKLEQYDYIVVHNMGRLSLVCSFLKLPANSKIISLEHVSFSSRSTLIQKLSKILYRKLDKVICLTNNDQLDFKKIHNDVTVISNFSPFAIQSTNTTKFKKVLAIGRLSEQKNFIHLLQAWKNVMNQIPDWSLNIYGDGELKNSLCEYRDKHNLKNISFYESTANIVEVYNNASFFVMSSKYEGLPMVLLEAQTFGLPIVSYDCPHGPKEIIEHGINGFLVENQNHQSLAEHIVKLATSEILLKSMSNAALKSARKYQPEKILDQWINDVFTK